MKDLRNKIDEELEAKLRVINRIIIGRKDINYYATGRNNI